MKARTKRKKLKYERLEKENEKYKEITRVLQNKIKFDDYLKKENEKLIEWVQKILEHFGTYNVNNRETVQIPVMRNRDSWIDDLHNNPIYSETIIIPEIVLHKMNRSGSNE